MKIRHIFYLFGSKSTAFRLKKKNELVFFRMLELRTSDINKNNLLHAFSSLSSLQSGLSLQKSSFSIHSPLPHCNLPSGQTGSSVFKIGSTLRGSRHHIEFSCKIGMQHTLTNEQN